MSKAIEQLFTERFRPKVLDDIILSSRVRSCFGDGTLHQNYLLVGTHGIGKTSVAKALASKYSNLYINISDESSVDTLRDKIRGYCERMSVMDGKESHKVVILDEMDGASDQFYKALRGFMEDERYVSRVRFIGTANYTNKIPEPVRSRFMVVDFNPVNKEEELEVKKEQIRKIASILNGLKITYDIDALKEFIKRNFPDMRSMLNKIQSWEISGNKKITVNDIRDLNYSFKDLFEMLVDKNADPISNYKYIVKNCTTKVDDVLMSLHNDFPLWISEIHKELIPKIPMCLVIIGKWQADRTSCIDPVVALSGCFFEIQMHMKG